MRASERSNKPLGVVAVAVVLASYNRCATTMRCLDSLRAASLKGKVSVDVFLFDDASTDGTADHVRSQHPETHFLTGDGNQFWGGGMRAAISAAHQHDYDFLLWLNDDVELSSGFLDNLLSAYDKAAELYGGRDHVIAGATSDPVTGSTSYSGYRKISRIHPAKIEKIDPDSRSITECDSMNGNCVLFPRAIVDRVGNISPEFIHQIGDVDYGYRCVQAGARIWIAPGYVGQCALNTRYYCWDNPLLSFSERWKVLNTPLGLPVRPWMHFMYRHGGPLAVALLYLSYAKRLGLSLFRRGSR